MDDNRSSGATPGRGDELHEIYAELQQGRGHHRVDDGNVEALIRLAEQRGDAQTRELLREWSAPCGEDDTPARSQP